MASTDDPVRFVEGAAGSLHRAIGTGDAVALDRARRLPELRMDVYWNIWSAKYPEAREIRAEHGGYLLAYKRHYFIVEAEYVAALGLDPRDDDWRRIGRDWARPGDLAARGQLYARLFRQRFER